MGNTHDAPYEAQDALTIEYKYTQIVNDIMILLERSRS